jgi:hypothetical protein
MPIDPAEVVEALREHPSLDALGHQVRERALHAARSRNARFPAQPERAPSSANLDEVPDAKTPFGDILEMLSRGTSEPREVAALSALLALSLSTQVPSSPESELELAKDMVWLSAHTRLDVLRYLDPALGIDARPLWRALSKIAAMSFDEADDLGETEALVAAAALAQANSAAADEYSREALGQARSPAVRAVLFHRADAPTTAQLNGEIRPHPRRPFTTVVLTFTLILPIVQVIRLVFRYALGYHRPVALRLSNQGLELDQTTLLLGRVVRQKSTIIPLHGLARVTREVRYARAGLYAGLVALVLGSYFGMGLFIDALRVPGGSLWLFGLATLITVLGLALDFALSTVSDSARGHCALIIVPERGRALRVGALDTRAADAMLSAVANDVRLSTVPPAPPTTPTKPDGEAVASLQGA